MARPKNNKRPPAGMTPEEISRLQVTNQVLRDELNQQILRNQMLLQKVSNTQLLMAALVHQELDGQTLVRQDSIEEMQNPAFATGLRFQDSKRPKGIKMVVERQPVQEDQDEEA